MAIPSVQEFTGKFQMVLCRGCGNRPLRRAVASQVEGAVQVVNPESGREGLFPERDVYIWDEEIASKINGLLDAGNSAGAEDLWNQAAPYGPESKG
jgi:hypothetical protein